MNDPRDHARLLTEGPWAGWLTWLESDERSFMQVLGPSLSRSDAPGRATVMLATHALHSNRTGALHGGFLAGFADHAYFAALFVIGRPAQIFAVTVDLTMQYCGAARVGPMLRAEVELLRETGRLMFMRLALYQDDELVGASSATLRKAPEPA